MIFASPRAHRTRRCTIEISGHHIFKSSQDRVWDVLTNPETLRKTLPGCKTFEPAGDNTYDISMAIGIGAVKGTYNGKVRLADAVPIDSYTLEVDARGAAGFMSGKGHFVLQPIDGQPNETRVNYTGDAHVGGPVAGVGQRLLRAGANLIIGQFFKSLEKQLSA